MKTTISKILMLVLVFSITVMASGCGGANSAPETADVAAAPAEPISFTLGSSAAFDTLNPLSSYMQVTYEFFMLIYDSLVQYDENYEAVPNLAKEWSVSDDNLTWTFILQDDVKWHDGEAFTCDDVKFTYELMLNTGLGYMYSSYLTGISDIQCTDDTTVVITTDEPKANMLMNSTPILPEHIWAEIAEEELEVWPNEKPIGTGPYKFDSTGPNFVKIVKNDDYFGTKPYVDEFIFVDYENADSMAQALMLGEIDAATNLNTAQMTQLDEDENVTVISGEEPGFMQIGVNCWTDEASGGNPLLLDKSLRQAIELAVNKQKIVDMAYNGQGTVGTTMINPGDFYHYEPTAEELRDYDVEASKALLAEAGYVDSDGDGVLEDAAGTPLEFDFITISDNLEEVKAGQMVAADLGEVGIKINSITMDSGALYDNIIAGTYDMFIWGWGADLDPTVIMGVLTTDQIGGNNEPFFSDARYDELFLQQQTELDPAKRQALVYEMQQIVYENAPYIILVYSNNIQAYRSDRWTGFKRIPDTGTFYHNLTIYNYMNIKPVE